MAPCSIALEDLPLELLQDILGLVHPAWLPNIRLTCRTLCEVAYDAFVSEYIQELSCYIFDPARRNRLARLTSSSKFAAKVKKLTLTADCLEGPPCSSYEVFPLDKVATVENQEDIRWPPHTSQAKTYFAYAKEQALLHHPAEPDLSSLAATLRNLDQSSCTLVADFTEIGVQNLPYYPYIVHEVLDTVAEAGFPLQHLHLADLSLGHLDRPNPARDVLLKGLKTLRVSDWFSTMDKGATKILPMVRNIQNLESLEMTFQPLSDFGGDAFATSTITQILLANDFRTLRELCLSMLRLEGFDNVRSALGCCRQTLRVLMISHVTIDSPDETNVGWTAILQSIRAMSNLEHLEMGGLCLCGMEDLKVYVSDEEGKQQKLERLDFEAFGHEEIDRSLAMVLDRGITLVGLDFGNYSYLDDEED